MNSLLDFSSPSFFTAIKRNNFFLDKIEEFTSFNGKTVTVYNTVAIEGNHLSIGLESKSKVNWIRVVVKIIEVFFTLGLLSLFALVLKVFVRWSSRKVLVHPDANFNQNALATIEKIKNNETFIRQIEARAKAIQAKQKSLPKLHKNIASDWYIYEGNKDTIEGCFMVQITERLITTQNSKIDQLKIRFPNELKQILEELDNNRSCSGNVKNVLSPQKSPEPVEQTVNLGKRKSLEPSYGAPKTERIIEEEERTDSASSQSDPKCSAADKLAKIRAKRSKTNKSSTIPRNRHPQTSSRKS